MKPAILVVDMLKDAFKIKRTSSGEYQKIVPRIRALLEESRAREIPVIYACDSFMEKDFMFREKRGFCIRGTEGAEVIDDLKPQSNELVLPKRRFSAFFKTFLDQELRMMGVDTIVLTGIRTEGCVYTSAVDAVAHDFYAVILEDCSASEDREIHEQFIHTLSRSRLFPLLKVMSSSEFLGKVTVPEDVHSEAQQVTNNHR